MGDLSIAALDGYALAASEFGAGDRTIVVAPAMAVPRRFYRRFAGWAGDRGWRVLTFDYRGIDRPADDSGPATWAREDLAGVMAHALQHGPVSLVGHSVVGQTLGLVPNARQLDRVALIASSHGHWRHYPAPSRWAIAGFWWLGIPALTRVWSQLPMRWVGAADLPRSAAREWARWGRHPMYTLGYEDRAGYEAFDRPLVHWSFPGDPYAPRTAVDALLRWYPAAPVELRRPKPADFGRATLGHFDFFREDPGQAWWPELLAWLEAP